MVGARSTASASWLGDGAQARPAPRRCAGSSDAARAVEPAACGGEGMLLAVATFVFVVCVEKGWWC
jgi:hypothetical protein